MQDEADYGNQCGVVYLALNGNITFHCTLCENIYRGFEEYVEHVKIEHYAKYAQLVKEESSFCSNDGSIYLSPKEENANKDEEISEDLKLPTAGASQLEFIDVNCKDILAKAPKKDVASIKRFQLCEQDEDDVPLSLIREITPKCPIKNKHTCTECNYSTDLKRKLSDHIRRHFGYKPFKCTECYKEYYRSHELKAHIRKNHSDGNEEVEKRPRLLKPPDDIPQMRITDEGMFQCTACEFTAKDRANIWCHVKRHSAHRPYQCQECSKSFYTRNELDTHVRSHTGEKPFLCTICGNSFTTSSKLALHMKKHGNIRDKQCPSCEMKFFSSTKLKNHMAVHSEVRPHTCEICKSSFKRRKALNNHMKLHENKREYACQVCPARFNQKPGLISHMKSKHSIVSKGECANVESIE